jgi:nucleoside-diphosphate-sugar epimerase
MKYVVTGATSFIGLELTGYLLSQQHQVVAVCRPNSKGLLKIPIGVEIVLAEMSDYGNLYRDIEQADVFVNLAWGGTGHDGRNVQDVQYENVINTITAMFAADKMGCKLFVEAGSQAEYGTVLETITEKTPCHPFSEYGKAKLEVKDRLFELSEQLGVKYIHLRIFSLFGENDHPWTLVMSSIDKMLRNEPVDLSPCTQNWNFLYIKDAVRQIAGLCDYAINSSDYIHEVFNIASKDTRVLKEFVEEMYSLTQSKSELHFGAVIPANVVSLDPDITKTESATGYNSYYQFRDIINNIIRNYKLQQI